MHVFVVCVSTCQSLHVCMCGGGGRGAGYTCVWGGGGAGYTCVCNRVCTCAHVFVCDCDEMPVSVILRRPSAVDRTLKSNYKLTSVCL